MQTTNTTQETTNATSNGAWLEVECRPAPANTPAGVADLLAARSILAVLDSHHHQRMPPGLVQLAARSGASLLLYDLATGSPWTTPFAPGDEGNRFRHHALDSRQLHWLGQHASAGILEQVERTGISTAAYLATGPNAGDLSELVSRERFEVVVTIEPVHGELAWAIHRARLHGATVVELDAHGHPTRTYAPVSSEQEIQQSGRVSAPGWLPKLMRRVVFAS